MDDLLFIDDFVPDRFFPKIKSGVNILAGKILFPNL